MKQQIPLAAAALVFLLLPGAVVAQPAPANTNLLKLDDSISIGGKNLKTEQTKDGGIRITGTNASEIEDGDPAIVFGKKLAVPRDAGSITFQVSGIAGRMIVYVLNEAGGVTYKFLMPDGDCSLDLGGMTFRNSEEPFTGKVKEISAHIPIPKEVGEYVIEISRLEILP
ncbi:MAG: hypothetical protein WC003_03510 [Terrimicrobiaceae bacterium]|jgi:hypothetical protein